MTITYFSEDTVDFLRLLFSKQVKYVIVGGEAVIYYGSVRLTGDIDLFYERSDTNVKKLYEVLQEFWGGEVPELKSESELLIDGLILQYGLPPNRIDLINRVENVSFLEAWNNKVSEPIKLGKEKFEIFFIGIDELIKNKKFLGRPKDLEDLKFLERLKSRK